MVFQLFTDGSEAGGHTVDWKHPYRGMTGQGFILMLAKRSEAGPEALHAPSAKPADNEVLNMFFHTNSILEKPPPIQTKRKFIVRAGISYKMVRDNNL